MADNIPIKPTKLDAANAAMPQAGDIVSKLQKYLVGRGVSSKKAAKLLADALDDFMADEADAEIDEADEMIEELRNAGIQGKSPEEIAEQLAAMIESKGRRDPAKLERFLRERVDARLAESE